MKQKFKFDINSESGVVNVLESAESDPGTFFDVHQETYKLEDIKRALEKGQSAFIEAFRRKNMFPPFDLSVKIYQGWVGFLESGEGDSFVVDYEDIESVPLSGERVEEIDDEDVDVELDDLLKDDVEDLSEDDIKEIDSDDDTPKFRLEDDSELEE